MHTPQDMVTETWRQQMDAGLRACECFLEGATRMYEAQLEAATEAHADAIATHKALSKVTDPGALLRLQGEWARANGEKAMGCWRAMLEAAMQTNNDLVKCLGQSKELK